jgi:gamma-glutamyl:cysteine ligase YbdK (ATP-grasp superfamily)
MNHRTFVYALKSWCKERETYPSFLKVQLANTLTAGMHVHVEVQPQGNEISILNQSA